MKFVKEPEPLDIKANLATALISKVWPLRVYNSVRPMLHRCSYAHRAGHKFPPADAGRALHHPGEDFLLSG